MKRSLGSAPGAGLGAVLALLLGIAAAAAQTPQMPIGVAAGSTSSGGGGSGCVPSGSATDILTDSGSGSCGSDSSATLNAGALSLGASLTVGSPTLGSFIAAFGGSISVTSNTAAAPNLSHPGVKINGPDGGAAGLQVTTYNDSGTLNNSRSVIDLYNAGGTGTSPTQTLAGQEVGRISGRGYGTTGYVASIAAISFVAGQNLDTATAGGWIGFRPNPLNTTGGDSATTPPLTAAVAPSGALVVGADFFSSGGPPLGFDPGAGIIEAQTGFYIQGSTVSDYLAIETAAGSGTATIKLPFGSTDFTATGGTSQVVKQTTSGGAFTVAQLASTDISGLGTAATVNTGTSGATIPLNNGGFTQSGTVNFSGTFEVGGNAITWPAAAISVARIDAGQTFNGTQIFQASGASSTAASFQFATNTSSSSLQNMTITGDVTTAKGNIEVVGSTGAGTTLANIAGATYIAATGSTSGGLILQSNIGSLILAQGGTSKTTNNAITITSPTDIAFNQYTTPGVLVNDSGGHLTTDSAINAASVSASFIADHRLTVNIAGTTYYLAASTTAW